MKLSAWDLAAAVAFAFKLAPQAQQKRNSTGQVDPHVAQFLTESMLRALRLESPQEGAMPESVDWSNAFANAPEESMKAYDSTLVEAVFTPWARLLVEALDPPDAAVAADVGCGTGAVSRLLAQRIGSFGQVFAYDLSESMLAVARDKAPEGGAAPITYSLAPGDDLPAGDDQFDALTCQQALQFFPDRSAGLLEMRRVLKPGAPVAIAVWGSIESSPVFAALAKALSEMLGEEIGNAYQKGPWAMADPSILESSLLDTGFQSVRVTEEDLEITFAKGIDQVIGSLEATGVASAVASLSGPDRFKLREIYAALVSDLLDGIEIRSNSRAIVGLAVAP